MRKLIALAALALPTPAAAAPPKLIVVIAVDQFSADLFDQYRPQFTGGFARVASGTVFRNGYQGHAITETCPGHAAIVTGDRPSRSGIIANNWMDQSVARDDKTVYCVEDERVPGTSSDKYIVSPLHLKVPTLGERMKLRWPRSRTVAVTGKDRSAVMMSGQRPDQRWYWKDDAFVSDLAIAPPRSVTIINQLAAAAAARAEPGLAPPPFCAARSGEIVPEGGSKPVGGGRFERGAGDKDRFRKSPQFDATTLALAAALVGEMKLGKGSAPDLLTIGLSATDLIGHEFGPGGQEMCLHLLSLDRDLGGFLAVLDRTGLDYAVALTADHGGQDLPERLRQKGIAATRVSADLKAEEVGKRVGAKLGLTGELLHGGYSGNIYLDRSLTGADRRRVLMEALAEYRAQPQVEAAFSAAKVAATPLPKTTPDRWTLIERARASFDPQRSGDIIVLLGRYVTSVRDTKNTVSTHGSAWDYDRRVPILFWRSGMRPSDREQPIETVDIMPTLAAMIGLEVKPGSVDGKCLLAVEGADCPAR
ncbi:MAG: alkaline phosphatase family protein [Sphingomicrobium sp.]